MNFGEARFVSTGFCYREVCSIHRRNDKNILTVALVFVLFAATAVATPNRWLPRVHDLFGLAADHSSVESAHVHPHDDPVHGAHSPLFEIRLMHEELVVAQRDFLRTAESD